MNREESALSANGHSALYVFEPATGRTSTQLFIGPKKADRFQFSRRERCLCTYSTLTTMALFFTVTLLLLHGRGVHLLPNLMASNDPGHEEPCLTRDCMITATQMLQKLNTSIDPCDDFYEYACGGWMDRAKPQQGHVVWSTLTELMYNTFEMMKAEYDKPTLDWTQAEHKAVTIYKSCMNSESISRNGIEPLRRIFEHLGGWSLLKSNMNFSNWSLSDEMTKIFHMGFLPIIWVGAVMDDKNTSRHIIGLEHSQITLRVREQYLDYETGTRILFTNETPLAQLKTWVAYTGVLLGADPRVADERADRLVEFEARLAKCMPSKKHIPSLYHLTSLSELQKTTPMLNWKKFLGNIFYNSQLQDDEPILIYGSSWLRDLNQLLMEYNSNEEGRRTLDDYMKWCIAFRLTPTLDRRLFNDSVEPLFSMLFGLILSPPRWLECAMQTEAMMALAVSSIYIRLRSPNADDVRQKATQLVHEMIEEIRRHLHHVTWMDEPTKAKALRKVENIVALVGYPDELLDPTYLNKFYEQLTINDEYFHNTVAAFKFTRRTVVGLLRRNPSRTHWDSSIAPVHVNAYYGFPLNRIVFPLAILQNPVFTTTGPITINYAMIGSIIGHELVHAFDDTGKEYDDTGNLNTWWSASVKNTSAIRGRCLIEQYNNYSFEGYRLDGSRTLNENVADFDGLNIAYNAFKRSSNSIRHQTLPGLNMTSEKIFFLSYAQLWCSKAGHVQFRRILMNADIHSVEKYRVIGPLSNFQPFASLYECPVGSQMNPNKKCNVH